MESVFTRSLASACAALCVALLLIGGGVLPSAAQSTGESETQATDQAADQAGDQTTDQAADQAADQTGDQGAQAETATPEEVAADFSADTVVATVDGTEITLGELIVVRRNLPPEFQQLPDEVLMSGLVDQLANQLLMAEAARDAGLDEQPAIRLALQNQERSVLAGAYLTQQVDERVTDEEIEAAYQTTYVDAEPVEEAHAAHILVKDEATAEEIEAKLADGGDFAALAGEYGTDATASRGGDLGWFAKDQMVPPFADAVFAMEPGTVSEPVETTFGWHVIKLFAFRERPVPPFAEVRPQIVQQLTQAAQQEVLAEIREGADVEIEDAAIPAAAIRADGLLAE